MTEGLIENEKPTNIQERMRSENWARRQESKDILICDRNGKHCRDTSNLIFWATVELLPRQDIYCNGEPCKGHIKKGQVKQ